MTVKQYEAFMTVAEHLNITRAAEVLHISQPAISKQLKLLQQAYGVTLYYKKASGGIALTTEGRVFLSYVRKIVRVEDALKTRFSQATTKTTREPFAVGGTYSLAATLLPRLLAQFKKTHSLVDVVLRTGPSYSINDQILEGDIEVGVVHNAPRSKRLNAQPYRNHLLVPFVHTNHAYARNGDLAIGELASAPLILRGGPRLKSSAESTLKQLGYKPNVVARCESLEAVRAAVRNKMGIGILAYDTVKGAVQRGEFKMLRVPGLIMQAQSFIVYHKERPLSFNATDFLGLLEKEKVRQLETPVLGA